MPELTDTNQFVETVTDDLTDHDVEWRLNPNRDNARHVPTRNENLVNYLQLRQTYVQLLLTSDWQATRLQQARQMAGVSLNDHEREINADLRRAREALVPAARRTTDEPRRAERATIGQIFNNTNPLPPGWPHAEPILHQRPATMPPAEVALAEMLQTPTPIRPGRHVTLPPAEPIVSGAADGHSPSV